MQKNSGQMPPAYNFFAALVPNQQRHTLLYTVGLRTDNHSASPRAVKVQTHSHHRAYLP